MDTHKARVWATQLQMSVERTITGQPYPNTRETLRHVNETEALLTDLSGRENVFNDAEQRALNDAAIVLAKKAGFLNDLVIGKISLSN